MGLSDLGRFLLGLLVLYWRIRGRNAPALEPQHESSSVGDPTESPPYFAIRGCASPRTFAGAPLTGRRNNGGATHESDYLLH
jgi:hypothetical protein